METGKYILLIGFPIIGVIGYQVFYIQAKKYYQPNLTKGLVFLLIGIFLDIGNSGGVTFDEIDIAFSVRPISEISMINCALIAFGIDDIVNSLVCKYMRNVNI